MSTTDHSNNQDNSDNEAEPVIKAFNFTQKIKEIQSVQKAELSAQTEQLNNSNSSVGLKTREAEINKPKIVSQPVPNNKIVTNNPLKPENKSPKGNPVGILTNKSKLPSLSAKPKNNDTFNSDTKSSEQITVTEEKQADISSDEILENLENTKSEELIETSEIEDENSEIPKRFINPANNEIYSFDEMFAIAAEEAAQENMAKLSGFDAIVLKQAMAKFITAPDMKEFSPKAQVIIKTIPDNSNNVLNHVFELPKNEIEKFLQKLYEYNKIVKDNKLSPQKLKDCLELLLRALQAEFFAKFSD